MWPLRSHLVPLSFDHSFMAVLLLLLLSSVFLCVCSQHSRQRAFVHSLIRSGSTHSLPVASQSTGEALVVTSTALHNLASVTSLMSPSAHAPSVLFTLLLVLQICWTPPTSRPLSSLSHHNSLPQMDMQGCLPSLLPYLQVLEQAFSRCSLNTP